MTHDQGLMAKLLAGSRGGLRLLEWTGSLVPQGALVKGERSCASACLQVVGMVHHSGNHCT